MQGFEVRARRGFGLLDDRRPLLVAHIEDERVVEDWKTAEQNYSGMHELWGRKGYVVGRSMTKEAPQVCKIIRVNDFLHGGPVSQSNVTFSSIPESLTHCKRPGLKALSLGEVIILVVV